MNKELIEILKSIEEGNVSYGEIDYLQSHKQEVLNTGHIKLCEWAGITEEEYNRGELNPDLSYEEDFIKLEIDHDGEGNALCTIEIDDGQKLVITEPELIGLKKIFDKNFDEIQEYFHQIYLRFREQ